MQNQATKKQLRSFGLLVGGIFLFIGLWPLLRHNQSVRLWGVVLGGLLLAPGLLVPSALRKPYALWMGLAHVLGWMNTRIILSIIFYAVFTPFAIILRLVGHDPMNRAILSKVDTYRVPRESRRASHMKHQF